MQTEAYPSVSLHNVAEIAPADWSDGGGELDRVPRAVGEELNVDARERVRHPAGCELRFVPETDDATVRVTLSARNESLVRPFWGVFQSPEPVRIGPEPTTAAFSLPDRLRDLRADAATGAFDPHVCRLRFESWSPVALHEVSGPARPPATEELPERRYLAYGTSITEGAGVDTHLGYVSHAARRLGVDALNLGLSGSAFCEPAMAEYLAGREDWDLATLSLSVNMANRGFTLERFRERVDTLVNAVASSHPETPIACLSLFVYHADICRSDDPQRARDFRTALRTVVEESQHGNLQYLPGRELLEATGLSTDLLHPGETGMFEIGNGLADELATRFE